jgi:hypothetical protein
MFQLGLDLVEVLVVVGNLQVRHFASIPKAQHLKSSHDGVSKLLSLEQFSDVIYCGQKVCLWWYLDVLLLLPLLLHELLNIVVTHLARHGVRMTVFEVMLQSCVEA